MSDLSLRGLPQVAGVCANRDSSIEAADPDKEDCPLYTLLILSYCQAQNDPFKDPLVYANLPDQRHNDTRATWLTTTTSNKIWMNTYVSWSQLQGWPFGNELSGI